MKHYVYLLSDPGTNEIFYVGEGKGSRVFSHFKESIDSFLENFKYDSPLMLNGNRITGVLYKDG